jgi:hypothetical protein
MSHFVHHLNFFTLFVLGSLLHHEACRHWTHRAYAASSGPFLTETAAVAVKSFDRAVAAESFDRPPPFLQSRRVPPLHVDHRLYTGTAFSSSADEVVLRDED